MNMTTTQTEKDAWFEKIKTLNYFKTTNTTDIFSYFVYQPYYPKSLNFMPVTSPCFMFNDKVYEVKTRAVKDEVELETYLDNHSDVALYYVSVSTEGAMRMFARFAHIDTDYRSPITIEEFCEKHKDVLHDANTECGTLAGLKFQMEKVNGIEPIFYLTKFISGIGQPINLRMEKLITDGKFVYV
jgi:hypothetical protein